MLAQLSPLEAAALLRQRVRPIVLAERGCAGAARAIRRARGCARLALMLPYSPLHHLLLEDFGAALVATSGNLSGEPVLTEPEEAQERLADVADGFLHHDRPIARPADDPVVRVIAGVARPLRLGRGTAPLELRLPQRIRAPTLAVGAYLKTTVALAWEDRAVVSPHIGELASPRGREVFAQVARDLQQLYGVRAASHCARCAPGLSQHALGARIGAADPAPSGTIMRTRRPWRASTRAKRRCCVSPGTASASARIAHSGAARRCSAEPGAWTRVASFRPFRLPGGERAAREPWRSALALCWESGHVWPRDAHVGDPLLRAAWEQRRERARDHRRRAPVRCRRRAARRLLDGRVTRARRRCVWKRSCEDDPAPPVALPLARDASGVWRSDWAPLLPALLDTRVSPAARAAMFHASLAQALCDQALAVRAESGVSRVGLERRSIPESPLTEQAQALLDGGGLRGPHTPAAAGQRRRDQFRPADRDRRPANDTDPAERDYRDWCARLNFATLISASRTATAAA